MRNTHRNLKDVKEQAIVALSVAKQWQQEQRARDADTEAKLAEQATAIEKVLDDRTKLMRQLHNMHRDFLIIQGDRRQQRQQQPQSTEYEDYYSAT